MAEGVPPGNDDRRLWHAICTKSGGVSRKQVSVCKTMHHHGHPAVTAFGRFEVISRAGKGYEFHGQGNRWFDSNDFACLLEQAAAAVTAARLDSWWVTPRSAAQQVVDGANAL